ncbi:maleylpyruvate isomerase N-terminal domain-containing protein [Micromonospora zhanjiangensis]|uniref:Maleylpyruvate isomerase N-terminal domain-containing protein n=1 Tax=Micromonospora zhanjiangensis TaxID=1522057 RepID=A0ABV8KQ86_9ACTN
MRDDVRGWLADGTRLFLSGLDALDDAGFDAPTGLPGWTRRHLVAHVHHNAEALSRLVRWARTGEETRMYADRAQRDAEIERGARLPVPRLRELVRASAAALAADFASLPATAWHNEVVTAQGRTVPATEIPWLRVREVTVHAVDLGTGVGFADLPDDLNLALALDVVRKRSAGGEAAALAGWLTGRVVEPPALRPWL